MKLWYYRNFKIITNDTAKQLGLVHLYNVYGDTINIMNCRSVWVDSKNRRYKVESLV